MNNLSTVFPRSQSVAINYELDFAQSSMIEFTRNKLSKIQKNNKNLSFLTSSFSLTDYVIPVDI